MIIKSESDVRKIFRKLTDDRAVWIESAAGGTPGLPDALLPHKGRLLPFELKAQTISGNGIPQLRERYGTINRNEYPDTVFWAPRSKKGGIRVSQAVIGRRLLINEVSITYIVGAIGTQNIYICDFVPALDAYERNSYVEIRKISCLDCIVTK